MPKKKIKYVRRISSSLASSPTEGQSIPSYNLNSVKSEEDLLRHEEDEGKQYKLTCQINCCIPTTMHFTHYLTSALFDALMHLSEETVTYLLRIPIPFDVSASRRARRPRAEYQSILMVDNERNVMYRRPVEPYVYVPYDEVDGDSEASRRALQMRRRLREHWAEHYRRGPGRRELWRDRRQKCVRASLWVRREHANQDHMHQDTK